VVNLVDPPTRLLSPPVLLRVLRGSPYLPSASSIAR
jgi:hypothetical protein